MKIIWNIPLESEKYSQRGVLFVHLWCQDSKKKTCTRNHMIPEDMLFLQQSLMVTVSLQVCGRFSLNLIAMLVRDIWRLYGTPC